MENFLKISVPKPCHEDWSKMNPEGNGRFCSSCTKTVVDFTGMKTPEIQGYFKARQGQHICGRFNNTQLESLVIQIPQSVLYAKRSYRKAFLLALFVTMGNVLFSCADESGNRKNIDGVEVVSDSEVRGRTLGIPISSKIVEDTLPTVTLNQTKKDKIVLIKSETTTGDISVETVKSDSTEIPLTGWTHIDTIPQ